jgi:hypothetical protein
MRCLWIEPTSEHEGLLPSWVKIFASLGIQVDAFMPRESLTKTVLFATASSHCRTHVYHGQLQKPGRFQYNKYDFVVLNSLEDTHTLKDEHPKLYLEEIQDIPLPVIVVSHAANLLATHPLLHSIINNPLRKLMVTAPHVAEQLREVDGLHAEVFFPVYAGDFPPIESNLRRAVFSVQGTIDSQKRHYRTLLDAVATLKEEGLRQFKVQILGKASSDSPAFWEEVVQRGLRSHIVHPLLTDAYPRYYRALATSHYLLPLLDETRPEYHHYFTYGATSSLHLALSMGLVPVVNRIQAEGWGIEGGCLLYDGADLVSAMRKAVNITVGELSYRQRQIREAQRFFWQQNALHLTLALKGAPLRFAA